MLPFLDLIIKRKEDGNFIFSIYRKPTHTGSYLKYNSYHPWAHKKAVAKSLIDRAKTLCDEDNYNIELKYIKKTLAKNGYPRSVINTILR